MNPFRVVCTGRLLLKHVLRRVGMKNRFCEICGCSSVSWIVPKATWEDVRNDPRRPDRPNTMCPSCFMKRARGNVGPLRFERVILEEPNEELICFERAKHMVIE